MIFGQLYNMRNIFLEKSYTKYGTETIARPFSKKSQLSISPDQYFNVLYTFSLFAKLKTIERDRNQAADHLLSPQIKLF